MKRLTVISLILMIPTFIVSFFGMNVPLPFMKSGWLGVNVVSVLCVVTGFLAKLAFADRPDNSVRLNTRKEKRKKRG